VHEVQDDVDVDAAAGGLGMDEFQLVAGAVTRTIQSRW